MIPLHHNVYNHFRMTSMVRHLHSKYGICRRQQKMPCPVYEQYERPCRSPQRSVCPKMDNLWLSAMIVAASHCTEVTSVVIVRKMWKLCPVEYLRLPEFSSNNAAKWFKCLCALIPECWFTIYSIKTKSQKWCWIKRANRRGVVICRSRRLDCMKHTLWSGGMM